MRFAQASIAAVAAVLPLALAQTSTECDPTKKSCPANTGLNAKTFSSDFTQGSSAISSWSVADGTTLSYGSNGAEFVIKQPQQAPTVQTDFYFLFGRVDVKMRAAPGAGVISSIVLESDDLDEIDWEFLGGNTAQVESNYFGKGNTTTYDRALYHPVSNPQSTSHTYSLDWTAERCNFMIDGTTVRTLTSAAANGGSNYPQTPMRLKLGSWTPPDNATGTIEWAGGPVDFSKAPFTMYVESVSIQNYNPADSYVYGDMSGSWQSIQIIKDGSSSGAGGASSNISTTASPSASAHPVTGSVTATDAPTSSHSVMAVQQTEAAVTSTVVAVVSGDAGSSSTTSPASTRTGPSAASFSTNAAIAERGYTAGALVGVALACLML